MGSSWRCWGSVFVSGFISLIWGACHWQGIFLFPFASFSVNFFEKVFLVPTFCSIMASFVTYAAPSSHFDFLLVPFWFSGLIWTLMHHFEKYGIRDTLGANRDWHSRGT